MGCDSPVEYRVRRARYGDLEQSTLRCRGHSFKPVGRLQLQIRTLTQRLYQLGTGEKESFRHARERASVS